MPSLKSSKAHPVQRRKRHQAQPPAISTVAQPVHILSIIRLVMLYAMPAVLFFSFYPVISWGSSNSMNFELSLPIIWLILYDILFLAQIPFLAHRFGLKTAFLGISDRKFFLLALFPLFATSSILWSTNPLRAILTAGLLWAVFIAAFASHQLISSNVVKITTLRRNLLRSLYISTSIVCLFCWLQCILDIGGVSRSGTLLCPGCTYRSFGFPHPSGFAIEPQFMGNLLLAPSLILMVDLLARPISSTKNLRVGGWLLFSFFVATLFIVFSRGAIFAFVLAAAFAILTLVFRNKSPRPLLAIPIIVCAFLLGLLAQGVMSELSPTTDTFSSGIAKSIHQLSLGTIDFREKSEDSPDAQSTPSDTPVEQNTSTTQDIPAAHIETSEQDDSAALDAAFDGYVTVSTDTRISLNSYAISTWRSSPANLLFGVGLGGAGVAMAQQFPLELTSKEIVQNEYISLLLETGVIGIALLIIAAAVIFQRASRSPYRLIFLTLAIAYAFSLLFFSGLPNALHIYLLLPLCLI